MRGRKPKPTILKLVTGNPGKRRLNENEALPPVSEIRPEAPDFRRGAPSGIAASTACRNSG